MTLIADALRPPAQESIGQIRDAVAEARRLKVLIRLLPVHVSRLRAVLEAEWLLWWLRVPCLLPESEMVASQIFTFVCTLEHRRRAGLGVLGQQLSELRSAFGQWPLHEVVTQIVPRISNANQVIAGVGQALERLGLVELAGAILRREHDVEFLLESRDLVLHSYLPAARPLIVPVLFAQVADLVPDARVYFKDSRWLGDQMVARVDWPGSGVLWLADFVAKRTDASVILAEIVIKRIVLAWLLHTRSCELPCSLHWGLSWPRVAAAG